MKITIRKSIGATLFTGILATIPFSSALTAEKDRPASDILLAQSTRKTKVRERTTETDGRGQTVNVDYFYKELSPEGDWDQTDKYGYVWQPRVAREDRKWHPYVDGRWAWTDYGWTWVSNEKFGWLTYHYGRWTKLDEVGWVWVPGTQWAPAWVSWRSDKTYVGWAPLPPSQNEGDSDHYDSDVDVTYDLGPNAYCFVRDRDFGQTSYRDVLVDSGEYSQLLTTTENRTRIMHREVNGQQAWVNYGPDVEYFRREAHVEVPEYRVNWSRGNEGDPQRRGNVVSGSELLVNAPAFSSSKTTTRADLPPPATVRQKLSAVKVDNGWQGVKNAQEVRSQVKQSVEKTRTAASTEQPPLPQIGGKTGKTTTNATGKAGTADTPATGKTRTPGDPVTGKVGKEGTLAKPTTPMPETTGKASTPPIPETLGKTTEPMPVTPGKVTGPSKETSGKTTTPMPETSGKATGTSPSTETPGKADPNKTETPQKPTTGPTKPEATGTEKSDKPKAKSEPADVEKMDKPTKHTAKPDASENGSAEKPAKHPVKPEATGTEKSDKPKAKSEPADVEKTDKPTKHTAKPDASENGSAEKPAKHPAKAEVSGAEKTEPPKAKSEPSNAERPGKVEKTESPRPKAESPKAGEGAGQPAKREAGPSSGPGKEKEKNTEK